MGEDPGFPTGPSVITVVLKRGRQEVQSQREMDEAVLLAVKMEEGATNHISSFSRSWKRLEHSPWSLWKDQPCHTCLVTTAAGDSH